jgi:chromosome segregation ATPase
LYYSTFQLNEEKVSFDEAYRVAEVVVDDWKHHYNTVSEELASAEEKLASTQQELACTKEELECIETKLESTEKELAYTKNLLESAEARRAYTEGKLAPMQEVISSTFLISLHTRSYWGFDGNSVAASSKKLLQSCHQISNTISLCY